MFSHEEVDLITDSDGILSLSLPNTSDFIRGSQTPTSIWKLNRFLMRNRHSRLGSAKLGRIWKELLLFGLSHTDCCLTVNSIDLSMKVDTVFDLSTLSLPSLSMLAIPFARATTVRYLPEFLPSLFPLTLLSLLCGLLHRSLDAIAHCDSAVQPRMHFDRLLLLSLLLPSHR